MYKYFQNRKCGIAFVTGSLVIVLVGSRVLEVVVTSGGICRSRHRRSSGCSGYDNAGSGGGGWW